MGEAKLPGATVNCEAGQGSGDQDFVERVLSESGSGRGEIPGVRSEVTEQLIKEIGMFSLCQLFLSLTGTQKVSFSHFRGMSHDKMLPNTQSPAASTLLSPPCR